MEQLGKCLLCDVKLESQIKKTGLSDIFIQCIDSCGPYIITKQAMKDIGFKYDEKNHKFQKTKTKILGRKQSILKNLKELRQKNRTQLIRISHDSVKFIDTNL